MQGMRTTVRLPDALLRQAKRYASDRGTTLTAVLSEGLREILRRPERGAKAAARRPMPISHGTGVQPGVDLSNTASLLALTEKPYVQP